MKPHDSSEQLKSLMSAARRAPDTRDTQAPFGFSTRLAAHAFEMRATPLAAMFESLSWRALAVSCLLMALTIASSYSLGLGSATAQSSSNGDDSSDLLDPISEVIEIAS